MLGGRVALVHHPCGLNRRMEHFRARIRIRKRLNYGHGRRYARVESAYENERYDGHATVNLAIAAIQLYVTHRIPLHVFRHSKFAHFGRHFVTGLSVRHPIGHVLAGKENAGLLQSREI